MKSKYIVLTIILFCVISTKCLSQSFDSIRVYAISMHSTYVVKIDRDMIRNETDPIILTDKNTINAIYTALIDTVKKKRMRDLVSNYIDIRLSFEFYEGDKRIKVIGITSYKTMFIDKVLYSYDEKNLVFLDRYIPGLSGILKI